MENSLVGIVGFTARFEDRAAVVWGTFFDVAARRTILKSALMLNSRSNWIGFTVSGLCLGLVVLAVLAAGSNDSGLGQVFSRVCHQQSDRCHHWFGAALPLCVRCIWIYLGLAFGHILFVYWKPDSGRVTRALIGLIGLMVLDVLLEKAGLYHNWFWSRGVTGFLFGAVVSHFTLLGLRELYCQFINQKTYVRTVFISGRTR